ncbi:hypothetical protein OC861_004320 [Tilletia horrida]|nr:hypothetical protein OC861_004320 [Tilletia horrida]
MRFQLLLVALVAALTYAQEVAEDSDMDRQVGPHRHNHHHHKHHKHHHKTKNHHKKPQDGSSKGGSGPGCKGSASAGAGSNLSPDPNPKSNPGSSSSTAGSGAGAGAGAGSSTPTPVPVHAPDSPPASSESESGSATKTPSGVEKCAPPNGMMTQYWDCCKLASAWPWTWLPTNRPSYSCAADGATILENAQAKGGCDPGGVSWACNQHQPFTDPNNPEIGYAIGARWIGHGEKNFYGACYNVQIKERPGKTLIFQSLNTGEDYKYNQIDMQIPGSGAGWGEHCYTQWGNNPAAKGRNFIPMESIDDCQFIPQALQSGCRWRWEWLYGKENPKGLELSIKSMCRIKCPKILTDRTGMIRNDDNDFPEFTAN